jgi:hypothetical protein
MKNLKTQNDVSALMQSFGFVPDCYDVIMGAEFFNGIIICVKKKRFKTWWYRKAIKKQLELHKPIGIHYKLTILL